MTGLAFALALLVATTVHAGDRVERLQLDEVVASPDGGRDVELYLRVETRYGEPVEALAAADVAVRDNGELVPAGDVELARLHDAGRGATIALALDVSRTMQGEPFEQARSSALAYLDRMGPKDRLAVVAFSDRVDVLVSFKDSQAQARERLRALEVNRTALTTVLFDATFKAVDMIRRGKKLPPAKSGEL